MTPMESPQGPICQSCGMPLSAPDDFGTGAEGHRSDEYCRFCFEKGAFTDPHISPHAMVEKCATVMAQQGIMPEGPARVLMLDVIPHLRRWRR